MELNVASEQDIKDELKRREMIRRDSRIKDLVNKINVAYNSGKIDVINVEEKNKGTSVSETIYHVVLK